MEPQKAIKQKTSTQWCTWWTLRRVNDKKRTHTLETQKQKQKTLKIECISEMLLFFTPNGIKVMMRFLNYLIQHAEHSFGGSEKQTHTSPIVLIHFWDTRFFTVPNINLDSFTIVQIGYCIRIFECESGTWMEPSMRSTLVFWPSFSFSVCYRSDAWCSSSHSLSYPSSHSLS